ncbi:hypothetical protein COOONC_21370 [Cooperia oncophora]
MTVSNAQLSQREAMALTVNEIVAHLVEAHREHKDVNLNRLKCVIAQKYGLSSQPKLVDIIAGVPNEFKDVLLPKVES